jgi:hypothetical protein
VATFTVTQARTYARELAQDEGGAISDTTVLNILNEMMYLWVSEASPRITIYAPSDLSTSFGSANQYVKEVTTSTMADVLYAMSVTAAGGVYGAPMERVEMDEMLRLHAADTSDSDTPTKWAIQRVHRPSTDTAGDVGNFNLFIHPRSNGSAFVALALREWPIALSGSSNVLDVSDEEARIIARLVAIEIARLIGKDPGFIEGIARMMPDKGQVILRKWKSLKQPKDRPAEDVI